MGLKKVHKEMLAARRHWVNHGRPRGSEYHTYIQYKKSKRAFRLLYRTRQHENEQDFYDELNKYAEVDQNKCGSLLKTKNRKKQ
jgi:hypothetical protein